MTNSSFKDKFVNGKQVYNMNDVNLETLKKVLEVYDFKSSLGFKNNKFKIGKKQQIVILDKVYFYFNGVCIFHRSREELECWIKT